MRKKHRIVVYFDHYIDSDYECDKSKLVATIDNDKYVITKMNAESTYSMIEDIITQAVGLEKTIEDIESIPDDDDIEVIE